MQVSLDEFEKALIDGRINIHQFLEVMVDNFGQKKAMEIIKKNLEIAMEKYEKDFENNDLASDVSSYFVHDQHSQHINLRKS